MPNVSICIPAYRQTVYLRKTLASIAEQDLRDFEVIISDDSPTNEVEMLVDTFRDRLPGLTYVRNSPALGTPANWNHAVSLARGKYIKIMHHDDSFTRPSALRSFVSLAEEHQAAFICSAALAVNEHKGMTTPHDPTEAEISRIFERPHRLLFGNRIGPPSSVMYLRSLGIGFDPTHRFLVDLQFYCDVLRATSSAFYLREPLIASISGASHNVTNTCFTREIELKENLDLYVSWAGHFDPSEQPELVNHFTALFIKYQVRTEKELTDLCSGLELDGNLRSAMEKAGRGLLLRRIKQRIARTALYQLVRKPARELSKVSYSQCGEDLIMDHLLTSLGITRPFFVDIGAHHPKYLNNTYRSYRKGARGVNIEPDPSLIKQFMSQRPGDLNLGIGVTDAPGTTTATLHIFNEPTLNTFSAAEADRIIKEDDRFKVVGRCDVSMMNINDVLDTHCAHRRIDILSMDVEGLDEALIRAMDFERHEPLIICLETISFSSTGRGVKNTELIDHIVANGYMVYADTNINTIFVLEHIWKR
jgi:FkbM family methyltransferase